MNDKQAKRVRDLLASAVAGEPNAWDLFCQFLQNERLHVDDLGIGSAVGGVAGVGGAGAAATPDVLGDEEGGAEAEAFILRFIKEHQITCDYQGTLTWGGSASAPISRRAKVGVHRKTIQDLENEILRHARRSNVKLGVGFLRVILNLWKGEQRQAYVRSIFDEIDLTEREPMSQADKDRAWRMLVDIGRHRFAEENPEYAAAAIETIMWQIKLKMLGEDDRIGLPVVLVVYSRNGGTGKSTLMDRILAALGSLSASTTISQLLDDRNTELWSRYALYVDDARPDIGAREIADFRRKVTLAKWNQRVPATGRTELVINRATMVLSTNFRINELFPDPSSMRRYLELFAIEHAPDAEGLRVVDEADWKLIWRSIDVDGVRPMEARGFGALLAKRQEEMRTKEPVELWLQDFRGDDPVFQAHLQNGRITSYDLYHQSYLPYAAANCGPEGKINLDGFGKAFGSLMRSMGKSAPFSKGPGRTTSEWIFAGVPAAHQGNGMTVRPSSPAARPTPPTPPGVSSFMRH